MVTSRSSRDTPRFEVTSLLPTIEELVISRQRFEPPRIFYLGAERREIREAVTIDVRTSRPLAAEAVTPALFIADVPVIDFEPVGPSRYRFFVLEPQRLQVGAPISFGYPDLAPAHRIRTRFGFRLEPPPVA